MDRNELETIVRKIAQEIVNDAIKSLNDYTDSLHGTSTQDITKLNAAVMDLSNDYYSEDTTGEESSSTTTDEEPNTVSGTKSEEGAK